MNDLKDICRHPISELLPHRPPMMFLDEACGMEGNSFKAKVRISSASPLFVDDGVPAWVGLEYMAQTVAAYAGAHGLANGKPVTMGMLLGTRAFISDVPVFGDGMELDILVTSELTLDNGISSMNCRIRDAGGHILAQAQITVIDVTDIQAFLAGRSS